MSKMVGIVGAGMATSLGGASVGCAAARAGILKRIPLKVVSYVDDDVWGGEPVNGCVIPGIKQGFSGIGRLLIIGCAAITDLVQETGRSFRDTRRTGFFLVLPNRAYEDLYALQQLKAEMVRMSAFEALAPGIRGLPVAEEFRAPSELWKAESAAFISRLLDQCGIAIPSVNQRTFWGNHAGMVLALQAAIAALTSGEMDCCIVGGVDSCLDPSFLFATAQLGVLKTAGNPIGLCPGEGGAFVVLKRTGAAQDAVPLCTVKALNIQEESANTLMDSLPNGEALAKSITSVLSHSSHGEDGVGLLIGDLNGDYSRALEWGRVLARLRSRWNFDSVPLWLPAEHFGEVGAAYGAVAICTVVQAISRGFAPYGANMLCFSADRECSVALCLAPSSV